MAYLWTGAKNVRREPVKTKIRVDGRPWFKGKATCVLVGNVGKVIGGISAFEHARPDDGRLDVGVVTADGVWQWARTLARTGFGDASASPFVRYHDGPVHRGAARPQDSLRDGWRGSSEGEEAHHRGGAARDHACALPRRRHHEHRERHPRNLEPQR